MEARAGIEPTNGAFAELCLTGWLPRRAQRSYGVYLGDRPCQTRYRAGEGVQKTLIGPGTIFTPPVPSGLPMLS